jgi:hypothetical protein
VTAARMPSSWGFEQMALARIELTILPDNTASHRVALDSEPRARASEQTATKPQAAHGTWSSTPCTARQFLSSAQPRCPDHPRIPVAKWCGSEVRQRIAVEGSCGQLHGLCGVGSGQQQVQVLPRTSIKTGRRSPSRAPQRRVNVLCEAAHAAMRPPAPLRGFGQRVRARRRSNIATVVLARKSACLAWPGSC